MVLPGYNPVVISFDPFNTATVQQHAMGVKFETADDRIFRYTRCGTTSTSAGKINTAPVQKTNHQNQVVQAAAAIGATSVALTLGATASVAEEYTEGLLVIGLTPGQGHQYRIAAQPATASAGTQTVTLNDGIQVALTTSSKYSLVHNGWSGAVEGTLQTVRPAGVPMTPVTASSTSQPFFWNQTHGVASVLNDGSIALASQVTLSGSVSGAVAIVSTTYATALATPSVGQMLIKVGVDTQYEPCVLSID